jgi:hypothetical protein
LGGTARDSGSRTCGMCRRPAADCADRGIFSRGEGGVGCVEALTWLARREGFEREQCGRGGAVTTWAARCIRVHPGTGRAQAVAAVAHELGHVLMHRPVADAPRASSAGCRGVQKVEADSVALVACARLGVDVSGSRERR